MDSRLTEIECTSASSTLCGRMLWLSHGLECELNALRPDVLLCMNGVGISRVTTAAFVQQSLPLCPEAMKACGARERFRMRVIGSQMRRTCRRAKLVIAQTRTMSQWIQAGFGIPAKRMTVVEPWSELGYSDAILESAMFTRTPSHLRLLYAGNTSHYKNLKCLTRAMAIVRRRVPQATLFLTCPPEHQLCKTDGVVGVGLLSRAALQDAYRSTSAFVTASLVESGNLTLVEAMSAGTPVIAADRPYARELCGDAAAYFDPAAPEAAALAITEVLSDSGRRKQMSARGLAVAALGRNARPYDRLIEQLASLAETGSPD